MAPDWKSPTEDVTYLLDEVIEHIPPPVQAEGDLQMQITTIDYSKYIGRIAIGRIARGKVCENQPISLVKRDGSVLKSRVKEVYAFSGLGREKTDCVESGDICAISGLDAFDIGDTVADFENPEGLPSIAIDEPTMSMLFTVNNSPFYGKEGDYVTSRHLRDRLLKETEKNLALRVEETNSPDSYIVYGRGILHLSVLIETMRREGYELQVGKPHVIIKEVDGKKQEPIELLAVDLPDSVSGKVIEAVTQRKGEMNLMEPRGDLMHLEFEIPSRGIIGLRNQVLNLTAGEAILSHRFLRFDDWKGEVPSRNKGVLIVHEQGTTIPFALNKLQDRGVFFVPPGVNVYEGQIVGEHTRENDLMVNVIKTKKLTNMRAAGSDDKAKLAPPTIMSLEQALEYIDDDEYVEITPKSIRLRKILLKEHERKRSKN
jgi:GTP-binding protein